MEWTEEGRERGRGRAGLKTKQKEKREGNSEGEEDGRGKGEAGEGRTSQRHVQTVSPLTAQARQTHHASTKRHPPSLQPFLSLSSYHSRCLPE